jgi:hypothetical protein
MGKERRKDKKKDMYSVDVGSRFLSTELHGITSQKTVSKLKSNLEVVIYSKQIVETYLSST